MIKMKSTSTGGQMIDILAKLLGSCMGELGGLDEAYAYHCRSILLD